MGNVKRAAKQSGCPRCGPITSLLRLVVKDDGFPTTEPYPGKPRCKPLELYYCPRCILWVTSSEKDARRALGRKSPTRKNGHIAKSG